jgi:hypothetical protein
VGLALQILSIGCVIGAMVAFTLIQAVFGALFSGPGVFQPGGSIQNGILMPPQPAPNKSSLIYLALAVMVGACGLLFFAGTGVKMSSRWGFGMSLVIAALLTPLGTSATLGIPIMVYCVLRLSGKLGPVPL